MAPRTKTTKAPAGSGDRRARRRSRRRGRHEQVLPLVALRETVIFPEMIVPLQVGREKSVEALNKAVADGSLIALVTQRQADREDITDPSELYAVGTLAKIAQVVQLQDGTVRAIVQGQQRLRLLGFESVEPSITARVEPIPDESPHGRRGPGARAHRPGSDRAVRPVGRAGAPGGGRRGPQHHRARPARGHGRVQPGHDHRAAPGAARDDRRHRAPEAGLARSWRARSRSSSSRARSSPRSSPRWTRPSASTSCASSSRPSSASWARTTRSRRRSTSCATRSRPRACPRRSRRARSRRSTG